MIPVVITMYEREISEAPFMEYFFKLTKQGELSVFKTFHFVPSNFDEEIEEMRKEINEYLKENGFTAVTKY